MMQFPGRQQAAGILIPVLLLLLATGCSTTYLATVKDAGVINDSLYIRGFNYSQNGLDINYTFSGVGGKMKVTVKNTLDEPVEIQWNESQVQLVDDGQRSAVEASRRQFRPVFVTWYNSGLADGPLDVTQLEPGRTISYSPLYLSQIIRTDFKKLNMKRWHSQLRLATFDNMTTPIYFTSELKARTLNTNRKITDKRNFYLASVGVGMFSDEQEYRLASSGNQFLVVDNRSQQVVSKALMYTVLVGLGVAGIIWGEPGEEVYYDYY